MKICTKCGISKDLSCFGVKRGKPRSWCKVCEATDHRRRYAENPEKGRAATKKYTAEHPEYRKKQQIPIKAWRDRNRPKVNAYGKKWRDANPDKQARAEKEWGQSHKGHLAAKASARRALKLKATPKWLSDEQKAQIEHLYLNRPIGYEV